MAYTTKYDYTLKFSPYLYAADGTTLKSTVSFKDTLEFKVSYQVKLNQAYWNEVVSQWKDPDGTRTYAKIEDVPLPSNTEYLFRASFAQVTDPADDGYVVESAGYKVDQPSNGTFIVTVDESASTTPTLYIYLVDPHRELLGTDDAFTTVDKDVDKYVGSYDENTKARKVTKVVETIQVQVPKEPNELDTLVTVTGGNSFKVSGALLPAYSEDTVTYETEVSLDDETLEFTLAAGFSTDDIELTTYPFALNAVPNEAKTKYLVDLNAVRPGIYQVYATYKGIRNRMRDLIITGCNILSPSKKLQSVVVESEDPEEDPTTEYYYNISVGESMILSLYANPVVDSKDAKLGLSNVNGDVSITPIPNASGCSSTAVLTVSEPINANLIVTAVSTLLSDSESGGTLASRTVKVIPEPQAKAFTAPEEFPEDSEIKLFDEVVDIFRYADGRKVFTVTIDDLNLYCIATNEDDDTATEFTLEYAMTIVDFVKKPAPETDGGGGE